MGIYNSSICRVRPLMKAIMNDADKFRAFTKIALEKELDPPKCYKHYRFDGGIINGEKVSEIALKPTLKHLEYLLDNAYKLGYKVTDKTLADRVDLFSEDECTRTPKVNTAKLELGAAYSNNKTSLKSAWYVLEGNSQPDIFIEGNDYIIICEGKWTEPGITNTTTYIKSGQRNQMIRHIQAAINYNSNKQIYAFYIVEKEYDGILEKDNFKALVETESSNFNDENNKDEAEKNRIIESYYEFITWNDLESLVNGGFKTKEQIRAAAQQNSK